ncbi:glycosyltransferase family 2 protein [Asaia bogorensis]|uniref:glycosyltransferase family 2 protein n=1 Tax=Asaia bogorensis TaxID=91915 RepID=UPI000EFD48B4|nr:glycosyltransferase family 2 protein [Asaia bogorensis]
MKAGLLRLVIYLDAARLSPRLWLTALWWRVLGKRVRSRAQFAALLSNSPHAYRLWLCKEPAVEGLGESLANSSIVAVVSEGSGRDATLRSLEREGISLMPTDPSKAGGGGSVWLLWLGAGDELALGAGTAYRAAVAKKPAARVIYADDDALAANGCRAYPHFKPRWNSELLRHHDYVTGAAIFQVDPTWLSRVLTDSALVSMIAKLVTSTAPQEVLHLPYILHHRSTRPAPQVPVALSTVPDPCRERPLPKVSIIVPTRNRLDLLRTCIEGLKRTNYPVMEVIIVDNGSDDLATLEYLAALDPVIFQILRDDGPFNFSRLNNRAARAATGELLCLLNNDIEILDPDWLMIMARQALRPDVGAVGACLLYPDGRIQHAGVILGICGGAAHAHRLLRPESNGYFRRHALPQFVSAVTAACLVVRRTSFEAVGGLDEESFAVAFNDVDLCMRLNQQGWQSLYEPRAVLIHHESVSRGFDRDALGAARLMGELAALKLRWGTGDMDRQVDPFHHLQLSRYSERFVIRING